VKNAKTLRVLWTAALVAGGSSGLSLVTLATPASAVTSQCLILGKGVGSFTSLDAAVAVASPGATLQVSGTCVGDTEITENLSLVASTKNGFTPGTLEGTGAGSVLLVDPGVTLNLTGLTITGGTGGTGPVGGPVGGGILDNGGTVNLISGSVTNNTAVNGGGVFVYQGTVNVIGGSVSDNNASLNNSGGSGAGIENIAGTVNVTGGSIDHNGNLVVAYTGGGIVNYGGTVQVSGGSISNNRALLAGGGLDSEYAGSLVNVTGGSIDHNSAAVGGGINCGFLGGCDTLEVSGGSISYNSGTNGGGVQVYGGTMDMSGGSITFNTATDGGGIFGFIPAPATTVNLTGGSIDHNSAVDHGGGIYNVATLFLDGGSITYNTAGDGGGIFNALLWDGLYSGVLEHDATTIANNNPQDVCPAYDLYNASGC
jgi:hypothetical protein